MTIDCNRTPNYFGSGQAFEDLTQVIVNGSGFKLGILLDQSKLDDMMLRSLSNVVRSSSVQYLRLAEKQFYTENGAKYSAKVMSETPGLKKIDLSDDDDHGFNKSINREELLAYLNSINIKPVFFEEYSQQTGNLEVTAHITALEHLEFGQS